MAERKAKQIVVDEESRAYPAIEVFLESRDRDAVAPCFADTREAIAALPKPKAEQGKRALHAINRTEALLGELFDKKDELLREAKNTRKPRR